MTRALVFVVAAGCTGWIDSSPPSHSELTRLNRAQLENTIGDLLGVRPDLSAAGLPTDYKNQSGFDNDRNFLALQKDSIEAYYRAFEHAIDDAFVAGRPALLACGAPRLVIDPSAAPLGVRVETTELDGGGAVVKRRTDNTERPLGDMVVNGAVVITATAAFDRIAIRASGTAAAGVWPHLSVSVDGVTVGEATIASTTAIPFVVSAAAPPGSHEIAIAFDNNVYIDPANDINVSIKSVELAFSGGEPSPEDCVQAIAAQFLRRAYRRPPTAKQLERFVQLASANDYAEPSLKTAVLATLLSPSFLYIALSGDRIDDYDYASRLAFTLWRTAPDDTLLDLAASGTLRDPDKLAQTVAAMLADSRGAHLFDAFVEQWLATDGIDTIEFEPTVFPNTSPAEQAAIVADMQTETRLFFADMIANRVPLARFVDADYTFASPRLAALYGVTVPPGTTFARVTLPRRAGVLGQAGVIAARTKGSRSTNVIHEGVFLLRRAFCKPPAPTPAGLDITVTDVGTGNIHSVRDSVNARAANPLCAGCHGAIDGAGMPFERLDSVGRWRDTYPDGQPVDSTQMFDGVTFMNPGDVGAYLANSGAFERCFAQYLATYGLARELTAQDQIQLDDILDRAGAEPSVVTVIDALVTSAAFNHVATE